jgi:hypothetical protein
VFVNNLGSFHLDRDKLIGAFKEDFRGPGITVPARGSLGAYTTGLAMRRRKEIKQYLFGGWPGTSSEIYEPVFPRTLTPA